MKKVLKKAVCIVFAAFVLVMSFPLSVFAVDPVSVATMFNGLAQAITAYGASHGVSMTFDVANTDGIGEAMHELWSNFRAGQQTADDYETIARAVYPGLYNKVMQAGEAVVGIRVAAEYVAELDDFWNWVLSGPAEMVKVDNEYYQFSQSQIGPNASPINVVTIRSGSYKDQPLPKTWANASRPELYNASQLVVNVEEYPLYPLKVITSVAVTGDTYAFCIPENSHRFSIVTLAMENNNGKYSYLYHYDGASIQYVNLQYSTDAITTSLGNVYYHVSTYTDSYSTFTSYGVPTYSTLEEGINALVGQITDPQNSAIGVKSYDQSGVADLPDNTDVNYQPLPYAGGIDMPWNNSLFGDGTGTLTDAQTDAITGSLDNAIARDGTLTLAGDDTGVDDPTIDDNVSSDPGDYAVPGLGDVFPFCLPFDIYNFVSALAAEPVAPHFTATLQFPAALGGNQTIDIDFDNPTFNQLAQLLRLLELLAFIVGLALLTRSMFIRG